MWTVSTRVRVAICAGLVALSGLVGVAPAAAHDAVSPSTVTAGSTVTVTLAVLNEDDLPTDGVEARLPVGFVLGSPSDAAGWTSSVVKAGDGAPAAVRWTGSQLTKDQSGDFQLSGTAPAAAGTLVWVVAQKSLGREDFRAPPASFSPSMTVTAAAAGTGASASVAPVPLAGQAGSDARTVDGVARSRATLALVLAGLALVAVVFFEMTLVRRNQLLTRGAAAPQTADAPAPAAADSPGAAGPAGSAGPTAPAAPTGPRPRGGGGKRKNSPAQPGAKR